MRSSVPVLAALVFGLPALATPGLAATCSAKGDGFGAGSSSETQTTSLGSVSPIAASLARC